MEPVDQFYNEWVVNEVPVSHRPKFSDLNSDQVASLEKSFAFARWKLGKAMADLAVSIKQLLTF